MFSASSLLAKVSRLKREALAAQPVDPLAILQPEQREYLGKWVARLFAEHSEPPDAAYAALLEQKHWTPFDWLSFPIVTENMSDDDAGYILNDFRDGVK